MDKESGSTSTHINWLLSLATSIRSKFYDDSIEQIIKKYLDECINVYKSIILVTGTK